MMPSTFPLERIGSPRKELSPCRGRAGDMGEASGPVLRRGGVRLYGRVEPRYSFLGGLPGDSFPDPDPEMVERALVDLQAGGDPGEQVLSAVFPPVDADAGRAGLLRQEVADVLETVLDQDVRVGNLDHPREKGETLVRTAFHRDGRFGLNGPSSEAPSRTAPRTPAPRGPRRSPSPSLSGRSLPTEGGRRRRGGPATRRPSAPPLRTPGN